LTRNQEIIIERGRSEKFIATKDRTED